MMVLFGTRERTAAEYGGLLADAGLRVRNVLPTPSPAGLSIIEATIA